MSSSLSVAAVFAVIAAFPAAAQNAEANLGRNLAAACANCHGFNGDSAGGTESLAGVAKDGTAQKMKDFKSGARPATIMHQIAKGYSDQQIDLIAAYFAAQKPGKPAGAGN